MIQFDVKLALVGESGCGKSSLLHRLVSGRYGGDMPPTYGTGFGATRVELAAPDSTGCIKVSLGVWDTSGAPRFHSMSRRFLRGADAVLVCWDPTSRVSWDSLRAWVLDVHAEEPSALIFLAATKSDLVHVPSRQQAQQQHGQPQHGQQQRDWPGAAPVPAPAGGGQDEGLELGVSVERWHGPSGRSAPPLEEQQLQQARSGTPPLAGNGRGDARPAAAPATPIRLAERPGSPAGDALGSGSWPAATERARLPLQEDPLAPMPAKQAPAWHAPAQQIASEHAAAATAELVANLTSQELPSPFAVAAGERALYPAAPSPAPSGGAVSSSRQASSAAGERQGRQSAGTPRSSITPAEEWDALVRRNSSWGRNSTQRAGSEGPEALPPPAVPLAAVEQYCSAQGGVRMLWLSSRTGEGVADAFTFITQGVMHKRWHRMHWLQQQCQQQGPPPQQQARVGRSTAAAAPRRAATAAPAAGAPLSAHPSRQRLRSADSRWWDGQQQAAVGGVSRSRSEGPGRARSASPAGGAGSRQHEYTVGGSQLGPRRAPEGQSCRIT